MNCITCGAIIPEGSQVCGKCAQADQPDDVFNKFRDVVNTIIAEVPKLTYVRTICYTVMGDPDYQLRIAQPDPFSNYMDIVARVTLTYKEKILSDNLITVDTDLTRFAQKLYTTIKKTKLTRRF